MLIREKSLYDVCLAHHNEHTGLTHWVLVLAEALASAPRDDVLILADSAVGDVRRFVTLISVASHTLTFARTHVRSLARTHAHTHCAHTDTHINSFL